MTEGARGHLAMLVFSVLISGSFSLGSNIADRIEPGALTAVRFLVAVVALLPIALAIGVPRVALQAQWRHMILGGLYGIYFVLMFEALKIADPVSTAAVFTLVPILSAAVGRGLLGQRTAGVEALALTVGAIGALWVIFRADLGALIAFDLGRGEQIFAIACIAHGVYTPLVRKLNRGEPVAVFATATLFWGFVIVAIYAIPQIGATDWSALAWDVWAVIFYLAIFASVASVMLVQFAALRLPAGKVMAYTYLLPSWVLVWELVQGASAPPVSVLAGLALTVMALLILLRDRQRA